MEAEGRVLQASAVGSRPRHQATAPDHAIRPGPPNGKFRGARPVCMCTPWPPASGERAQAPRRIPPGPVTSQLGAALSRSFHPQQTPRPATNLQSAAVRKGLQDRAALCRAHRAGALQAHAAVARQGGREGASRCHGGKEGEGGAHFRAEWGPMTF